MKQFFTKVFGFTGLLSMTMLFTVAAYAAEGDISEMQWIADVIAAYKGMGGADGLAIVSTVIMLIVGLFKVPLFREKVWDKLKFNQKAAIPLFLGLIAGLLKLEHITWGGALAYIGAGAGAMALYEILDIVKLTNGMNATVKAIIGFIQGILKTGK